MDLLEDYKGYKIPSKVKLVTGEWKYQKYTEKQAFVVDAESNSQLETAINWAGGRYDEEKKSSILNNIIETENEEFEVEFLNSAGCSSQGGKLSFWDCKVTKNDISYIIGINQDLLLELIKSATIIKGKVQEKCLFMKQRGNTGIIIKDSEIYKECMKEIQIKSNLQNLKKTSSWEKGYYYSTPTGVSHIYIGDAYLWYTQEKTYFSKSKIHKLDKPRKVKIMISSWYADRDKKLSDIIENKKYFFEYIEENSKKSLPLRFKVEDKTLDIDLSQKELENLKLEYLEDITKEKLTLTSSLIKSYLTTFTPEYPILPKEIKDKVDFEVW